VIEVGSAPAAVTQIRHAVARLLVSWELTEICDDAVLCLSEALTNAVLHARPVRPVTVTIHRDLRTLRIEIADADRSMIIRAPGCLRGPGAQPPENQPPENQPPENQPPENQLDEFGRGLQVIDALAARWGVDADDAGKRVWFEQDIPSIGRLGAMP